MLKSCAGPSLCCNRHGVAAGAPAESKPRLRNRPMRTQAAKLGAQNNIESMQTLLIELCQDSRHEICDQSRRKHSTAVWIQQHGLSAPCVPPMQSATQNYAEPCALDDVSAQTGAKSTGRPTATECACPCLSSQVDCAHMQTCTVLLAEHAARTNQSSSPAT